MDAARVEADGSACSAGHLLSLGRADACRGDGKSRRDEPAWSAALAVELLVRTGAAGSRDERLEGPSRQCARDAERAVQTRAPEQHRARGEIRCGTGRVRCMNPLHDGPVTIL